MIVTVHVINGYRHEGRWKKPLLETKPSRQEEINSARYFLHLLLRWNLHLLALTKPLTRHKNFADSVKFTVLIDLSARDLYFL